MARSKNENLNNPKGNPKKAPLEVTSNVHFDMGKPVPKRKLQDWLSALPDTAQASAVCAAVTYS